MEIRSFNLYLWRLEDSVEKLAPWFMALTLVAAAMLTRSEVLAFAAVAFVAIAVIRGGILHLARLLAVCGPTVGRFVDSLSSKLAGKVTPEFASAIKSLNQAHENDKLLLDRLGLLESKVNALTIAAGIKRRDPNDVVTGIMG